MMAMAAIGLNTNIRELLSHGRSFASYPGIVEDNVGNRPPVKKF